MNQGMIVGLVYDGPAHDPVAGAIVGLNHIENTPERGGRLRIYTSSGAPASNLHSETDSSGRFGIFFQWDPRDLGEQSSLDSPEYQLNVLKPVRRGQFIHYPVTRHRGRLIVVVSLRAVADGRIPDVRSPSDVAGTIATEAMQIGRGIRMPNMFLSPGRPSAEYYALLGATRIHASSSTATRRGLISQAASP